MTTFEQQTLNHGGIVQPTRLELPEFAVKFCQTPENEFNLSIPRPLQDCDFNNIPISQLEDFSNSAHMDNLHRLDQLADEHRGAIAANAILDVDIQQFGKEGGVKNFINRFKKK